MKDHKDNIENFIKKALEGQAEEICQENAAESTEKIPDEVREKIRENLKKEMEEYEWKRRYPQLSDEEREALRLGQELLEKNKKKENIEKMDSKAADADESGTDTSGTVIRMGRKHGLRFYISLAAVLILAMAVSVTALGGPERIVRTVKSLVRDREVVQIDSGEEKLLVENHSVEEAYQLLAEEFGVEPVKLVAGVLPGMKFISMEYDEELPFAELFYLYKGENLFYFINGSYGDSSWSQDVEDKVTDEYAIERKECIIEVTEYETPETKTKRYEAKFHYRGLEYRLIGTMDKEEFELILQILTFNH